MLLVCVWYFLCAAIADCFLVCVGCFGFFAVVLDMFGDRFRVCFEWFLCVGLGLVVAGCLLVLFVCCN